MATLRKITPREMDDWRLTQSLLHITGHHLASDLYQRHSRVMSERGRTSCSPVRLGQILAEHGAIRKPKWDPSVVYTTGEGKQRRGQMRKGWIL